LAKEKKQASKEMFVPAAEKRGKQKQNTFVKADEGTGTEVDGRGQG